MMGLPGVLLASIALIAFASSAEAAPSPAAPTVPATDQAAQPPFAKFLPPLEEIALPDERPILSSFAADLARAGQDPKGALAAADAALAKATAPTKLRGFIQLNRAAALSALHRELDALDAVQESVRLLPRYSAPLITAVNIYVYLNRPGDGADYLIRAMQVDPQTVRTIGDYDIGNLTMRLNAAHDERRVRAVSDQLLAIGWIGDRVGSRSSLAVDAIKHRMAQGDVAGSRTLVPRLLVPGDSYDLLIDVDYQPLWPDVERWAGAQLKDQWATYLTEAHDRWAASKSAQATLDYLSALRAAGHYRTAVRDVLPLLEKPDKLRDYLLIFAVSSLADSLARLDRWSDVDALFARAQSIWPIDGDANALNIGANHARFLLFEGKPKEALKLMDEVLALARHWGSEVNINALAAMHHYRACMLHELGRDAEAVPSVAIASSTEGTSEIASLYICKGDTVAAKKVLMDGLDNADFRDSVIRFLQPPTEGPLPSAYSKRIQAGMDALRADPDLLKKASQYGRIVPWAQNAGAPPEAP